MHNVMLMKVSLVVNARKNEILQMSILNPKLAILDETDSGLDVDAVRIVSEGVQRFHNEENAVLIITHHNQILQKLNPDYVHVLINGKIVKLVMLLLYVKSKKKVTTHTKH